MAVVGASCGNTGRSPRSFGTRSRGIGGNTGDLWTWRRGVGGDGDGGIGHRRVMRVDMVERHAPTPKAARRMSRGFGFAMFAPAAGAPMANADAHGAASPSGRAPGRARGERARSKGFGPEVVCVSVGRVLVATPDRRRRARCGGGRGIARPNVLRVQWALVSTGRGTRGSVALARSGNPGGLRSNGGGRRQRGIPRQRVTSRGSGGNIASAPVHPPIRFFPGSRGLNGRGLRLMSCRSPGSSKSRGFAPEAEATRA